MKKGTGVGCMSADKRKVIIVTDGDRNARKAVEIAARNVGARCISCSAGNPTRQTGEELVELIKTAPADPVVLMLDDRGYCGMGNGERALAYISRHPDIQVLGVLAVASNITGGGGCTVDLSVAGNGEIVREPVNKVGKPGGKLLRGDTVEIVDQLNIPLIIGIGDIGKMNGADDVKKGAPLTTKALQNILSRNL